MYNINLYSLIYIQEKKSYICTQNSEIIWEKIHE